MWVYCSRLIQVDNIIDKNYDKITRYKKYCKVLVHRNYSNSIKEKYGLPQNLTGLTGLTATDLREREF